jgi:hypothetical protein
VLHNTFELLGLIPVSVFQIRASEVGVHRHNIQSDRKSSGAAKKHTALAAAQLRTQPYFPAFLLREIGRAPGESLF